MKNQNIINSPRLLKLKKQRRRILKVKMVISLIAISLILASLTYISRTPGLRISRVEVVGNKVLDAEVLQGITEEEVSGSYLWLFPKKNILIYPRTKIKNQLLSQFKRIASIDISIGEEKTLEIVVFEREALYTWCGESPYLEAELQGGNPGDEKCYFMDREGYIFDEAPFFSGDIYFKFYGPSGGIDHYFEKSDFHKLVSFKETIASMNLKPVALSVLGNKDIKIFLEGGATSLAGPEIIFKIDADFDKVAENLESALSAEPLHTDFISKYSSLEYIDLRFGNKVYYKFNE